MKLYTLTEEGPKEGIHIHKKPYPHVEIGEAGPNTRNTWLPLGVSFGQTHPSESVKNGYVIRSQRKGTLLLVEERTPDRLALVKLAVPPGKDGGIVSTAATYRTEPCQFQGETLYPADLVEGCGTKGHCRYCRELVENSVDREDSAWLHPNRGSMRIFDPLPTRSSYVDPGSGSTIAVIAEGTKEVPGAHQRVYSEMLMTLEAGAAWRVLRYGQIEDGEWSERVFEWDGEVLGEGLRVKAA